MLQPRHEWKHEISYLDHLAIRQRLSAVATPDAHATNGRYLIRSLYFDTPTDRALREKLDGVNQREKFRIRLYDGDISFIKLEKKSKFNGLGTKDSARLSAEEAQAIVDGDLAWMAGPAAHDRPLISELYAKMRGQNLRPRTIVDYEREPFTYVPGNVRVTIDFNIRTGLTSTDFLNPRVPTIPVPDNPTILEVKWDNFLPSVIRDACQLTGRHAAAFSKYAACRSYD